MVGQLGDRGSITTSFIYCGECFHTLDKALSRCIDKKAIQQRDDNRIVSGYIKGGWPGHEFELVEKALESVTICEHCCSKNSPKPRVAVLSESAGDRVYKYYSDTEFTGWDHEYE